MVTVAREIFQTGILHFNVILKYVHYEQDFSQTLFFEHQSIISIILFVNYLEKNVKGFKAQQCSRESTSSFVSQLL